MKDCVNLETEFPGYRIRMSQDHLPGERRDPWNFEIPCSRFKAKIYPHGGDVLQAWITTRNTGATIARLRGAGALPWQTGDTEASVLFRVADFDKIAVILKPRRKRPPPAHFFGQRPAHTETFEPQNGGSDEKPDPEAEP